MNTGAADLAIVMPVYNEAAVVGGVIRDWIRVLMAQGCDFRYWVIDDGSTDATVDILTELAVVYPEVKIERQPNLGHGVACRTGYRRALDAGARWILQIDSDGQCDPGFFADLWSARRDHPVVYGCRIRREDGLGRALASRVVSGLVRLATGVAVRDANVPYRLMRADAVEDALGALPGDIDLVNVFVAVRQQQAYGIAWRDIVFRRRGAGSSHLGIAAGVVKAVDLYRSLRAARHRLAD